MFGIQMHLSQPASLLQFRSDFLHFDSPGSNPASDRELMKNINSFSKVNFEQEVAWLNGNR